jgi:hypothetical protein
MAGKTGMEPCSAVAETLANVAPPGGATAGRISRFELGFAPLCAPAELSPHACPDLASHKRLPPPALGVSETHPHEVKKLMDQDAFEFPEPI